MNAKKPGRMTRPGLKDKVYDVICALRKQIDGTGLLDRIVDFAMKLGGNTRYTARKDFPGLGGELGEEFRIGGDDEIRRDIVAAPCHHTVRLTEIDTALNCFWLGHGSRSWCVSGVRGVGCGA